VAAAALLLLFFVSIRNGLIQQRNQIRRDWTDLDQLLKQRRDELPRLLGICRSYLADNPEFLEPVTAARSAEMKATEIPDKARASSQLSAALRSVFAAGDRHQALSLDASYRQLRKLLSELDDRITQEAARFNEQASAFNARLARPPGSLVGRFAGLKAQARFDIAP
jgi:LemA protein